MGAKAFPGILLSGSLLLYLSLHSHPPSRARAIPPGVHCDPRKQCARRAWVASHETLLSSVAQLTTKSQDYDKRFCSFCSFCRYTNMVYFRLSSLVLYWVGSSGPGLPGGLVCEANNFRLSSFVSRPSLCAGLRVGQAGQPGTQYLSSFVPRPSWGPWGLRRSLRPLHCASPGGPLYCLFCTIFPLNLWFDKVGILC